MNFLVVPPLAPGIERTVVQDRAVIKRFFARKLCASLATGAFQDWDLSSVPLKMAFLRLQSILVYNLLDRGYRIGKNMSQGAAINLSWIGIFKFTNGSILPRKMPPFSTHRIQTYTAIVC